MPTDFKYAYHEIKVTLTISYHLIFFNHAFVQDRLSACYHALRIQSHVFPVCPPVNLPVWVTAFGMLSCDKWMLQPLKSLGGLRFQPQLDGRECTLQFGVQLEVHQPPLQEHRLVQNGVTLSLK